MHFILGLATGGKNEQIVRYILYNRKLSFSNVGRRILRNFFKNEEFFAPFEDKLSARGGGEYFKKLLNNSPKDAAIWFLVESQFRWAGVWGRYGIATAAEKFNKLYDDWKTGNNDVRKMD